MEIIVTSIITGLLSTGAMSIFLWFVTGFNIVNADMIRAIGSLITRDEKNALLPGLFIHFNAGTIFTCVYILIFHLVPNLSKFSVGYIVCGSLLGIVHGVIVSLFLTILVAEHHPLEKYKKAGFGVAVSHFLAHLIFGFCVGLVYTLSQLT